MYGGPDQQVEPNLLAQDLDSGTRLKVVAPGSVSLFCASHCPLHMGPECSEGPIDGGSFLSGWEDLPGAFLPFLATSSLWAVPPPTSTLGLLEMMF